MRVDNDRAPGTVAGTEGIVGQAGSATVTMVVGRESQHRFQEATATPFPPVGLEVEVPDPARAAVGALLGGLAPDIAAAVLDVLADVDLDDPRLRCVLRVVRRLHEVGRPCDPIAVLGEARRSGDVSAVGTGAMAGYLAALTGFDTVPMPVSAVAYACAARDAAVRRQVTVVADRLRQVADDAPTADLVAVVRAQAVELLAAIRRLEVMPDGR